MRSNFVRYAEVRARIDHPIDRIWAVVRRFGDLDKWAQGVTGCTVVGEGAGAVRTVSLGDRTAHERLEEIDEAEHRLRYHILPPHGIPMDNVYSDIRLIARDDGQTDIVWTSEATDFRVAKDIIGGKIEAFYSQSLQGLLTYLEGSGLSDQGTANQTN